jgi:hypothetical protein
MVAGGIVRSSSCDKLISLSTFVIPQSVYDRHRYCQNHPIAMNHPLCNVEQSVKWLVKPVAILLDHMHSSTQQPNTRSSYQDALFLGQDLFLYSMYSTTVSDFVCSSDDVELVNFVETDSSKKIWHCSDIVQSAVI